MKKIIEAHKFFARKSQHYIMGNWNEYEDWLTIDGFNKKKLLYMVYYPIAYIKFMYMSIFK